MKIIPISIPFGLLLLSISNVTHAGLFDDLKDKVKKEKTQKVIETVKQKNKTPSTKTSNQTPSKHTSNEKHQTLSLSNSPSEELIAFTECTNFKPENITLGYRGEYTFKKGFKKEKRTGFINRTKGNLSHGCILPSLQSKQIAYMEVDTKKYEALGNSNSWSMQCLRSADPDAGAITENESKTESIYSVSALSGKDMMLHCGNSEGITECASGSNSKRGGEWKKKLKAKGKTMLSIHAFTSTLAPEGGEKLYCQYYNETSGKSLFAVEYIRSKR